MKVEDITLKNYWSANTSEERTKIVESAFDLIEQNQKSEMFVKVLMMQAAMAYFGNTDESKDIEVIINEVFDREMKDQHEWIETQNNKRQDRIDQLESALNDIELGHFVDIEKLLKK